MNFTAGVGISNSIWVPSEIVAKEVAVHFLAYNLVRSVMAQAAHRVNCKPRELSFKGAMQQLRAFEVQLRIVPLNASYGCVMC